MLTLLQLKYDDPRIGELLQSVGMRCYEPAKYEWFGVEDGCRLCAIGAVWVDGKTAYLYCGAVDEDYRGNGLHQDIINARVDYARQMGCKTAMVSVYSDNYRCKNSLTRAGFAHSTQNKYTSSRTGLECWYKDVS